MNQPLVTIAVPIYNVEKYLHRCIRSLVNQTYRNLEIILVDDCSPESSPQICDEWAQKDTRIRVIHKKKNEGQGFARNDALAAAGGKYICFFDGDDYVEENAISALVAAAEKETAELTVFGTKNIASDGTVVSEMAPGVGSCTYRGREVTERFLPDFLAPDPQEGGPMLFHASSCVIMYAVEKLRSVGWKYVSEREIISEDVYSLLNLFDSISTVTVVPQAFYCYCANEASFSRRYTPGRYERVRHFYLESVKLCEKKGYSRDVIHRISSPYLAYTIGTLKQEAKAPISLLQRWKNVRCIMRDETLQQVLQQNRHDCESKSRRVIFFLMRNRLTLPSFLLFRIKK